MKRDELDVLETSIKAVASEVIGPFDNLLTRMLGPAADEIGVELKETVTRWRERRNKRQQRFEKRVGEMVVEARLEIGPVSPKLLIPILERASLEDDDYLQDRWAALLANAGSTDSALDITSGFVEILKQLTPDEVRALDEACEEVYRRMEDFGPRASRHSFLGRNDGAVDVKPYLYAGIITGRGSYQEIDGEPDPRAVKSSMDFSVSMDNLTRLGLVLADLTYEGENKRLPLSHLGFQLVMACKPPKALGR